MNWFFEWLRGQRWRLNNKKIREVWYSFIHRRCILILKDSLAGLPQVRNLAPVPEVKRYPTLLVTGYGRPPGQPLVGGVTSRTAPEQLALPEDWMTCRVLIQSQYLPRNTPSFDAHRSIFAISSLLLDNGTRWAGVELGALDPMRVGLFHNAFEDPSIG